MWVWLLVLGCWEPTESGPKGMVGRIVDPTGSPIAGIDVSTLEEHVATDADGGFAIQYKAPEQFIGWSYGASWFRRLYREADQGTVVEVRLPLLRDTTVGCELDTTAGAGSPCPRVALTWDLGDGLIATADVACERVPVPVVGVPPGEPTATCGVPARVYEIGDRLVIRPPPTPLRIEIRANEGASPGACVIRVGDRLASPMEGGFYVAEAAGRVQVGGACDGRPLFPKVVAAVDGAVVLDWSPTGPVLDLSGLPVPAGPLRLVRDGDGATLEVNAAADGSFQLPPLPEGRYRVGIGDPAALATFSPPAVVAPGALRLMAEMPRSESNPGGMAGMLVLGSELDEGRLPVVLALP